MPEALATKQLAFWAQTLLSIQHVELPLPIRFRAVRDEIIVVDLGTRVTKGVWLRRQGNSFVLAGYTLRPTTSPIAEASVEALSANLEAVRAALGAKTKNLVVVLGMEGNLLRHGDFPSNNRAEIRKVLTLNSKAFFQQELKDYLFDCWVLGPTPEVKAPTEGGRRGHKTQALVGGVRSSWVNNLKSAAASAELTLVAVTLSQIGVANAARTPGGKA